MSAETNEPETIGHMLTRFRLLVEDCQNSDPVRREILDRFDSMGRARDHAVSCAERAEQERDAAVSGRERAEAGRREEAQRAADLTDEVQRMREERDAAVAALAVARAEVAQLTEQLQKAKEDYIYQNEHAQTFFDESRFMRDLILDAMRGGR